MTYKDKYEISPQGHIPNSHFLLLLFLKLSKNLLRLNFGAWGGYSSSSPKNTRYNDVNIPPPTPIVTTGCITVSNDNAGNASNKHDKEEIYLDRLLYLR